MREITCAACGTTKMRPTGEVNRAIRSNASLYCSRECSYVAKRTGRNALGWHERRFEERPGAVHANCAECGRSMWLPPSKVDEYKRCGPNCQRVSWDKSKGERARNCVTCGTQFTPRRVQIENGNGLFCSRKCIPSDHLVAADNLMVAQQRRREVQAAGLINWKTGPDHHSWKGGQEASLRRRVESGKAAEGLRRYRAANKERVREWMQNRKNGKLDRLPYGTIPKIGRLQKWKCGICRTGVKSGYHLDHIMPIARGGRHEPRNLQLLCGPCNLRKSARDPIHHMQSIGRLL